jgi:hypothetical protein
VMEMTMVGLCRSGKRSSGNSFHEKYPSTMMTSAAMLMATGRRAARRARASKIVLQVEQGLPLGDRPLIAHVGLLAERPLMQLVVCPLTYTVVIPA